MQLSKIIVALALQTAAVLAAPPVSPEDAAVNAAVPQGVSLTIQLMNVGTMILTSGGMLVLRLLPGSANWLCDLLQLSCSRSEDAHRQSSSGRTKTVRNFLNGIA